MTPDNQNIVTENVDGSPWINTSLELSQERAAVGGQSLKMSHLWNLTDGTADSQNIYGAKEAINPQFAACVTEPIPFPLPLDQAFAGAGPNIADVSGSTVMAPEINIKANIADMGQRLEISSQSSYPAQMKDPISKRNVYLGRGVASSLTENSLTYKTFLRSFCVTFSNYLPEEKESMGS